MTTVLVTGASSGIGEACVGRLGRAGHRVFAGVRRAEDGARLRRQHGPSVDPVLLDVTDPDQIAAAIGHVAAAVGPAGLGGLVNNAGIAVGGPVELLPIEEWRQQLEVNVLGQVAVTQAAIPLLRRSRGRIVFIGSISGRLALPLMGPYAASKHAVAAVAESLREELRPWGMHVTVVEPGAIRTPIWAKGRVDADRLEAQFGDHGRGLYGDVFDRLRAGIDDAERTGLAPDEVAKVVERALTARRPWSRVLVGRDARAAGVLERLLPDRALAVVLRRMNP